MVNGLTQCRAWLFSHCPHAKVISGHKAVLSMSLTVAEHARHAVLIGREVPECW